jgi:polyhydroxybutyrate depolymerase
MAAIGCHRSDDKLAAKVSPDGCGTLSGRNFCVRQPSVPARGDGYPLILFLHGRGGEGRDDSLGLSSIADELGFVYVFADGVVDPHGARSWKATDACCDRGGSADEDVRFLTEIVQSVLRSTPVDPKRVYVAGFSNGGFMAHRLACDSPLFAAAASVSGAQWKDPGRCRPSHAVSVLEVHGARDPGVKYNGGLGTYSGLPYPSAEETVSTWASVDGCGPSLATSSDLVDMSWDAGSATAEVSRATGCPPGVDVELWTLPEGGHGIHPSRMASLAIARFLLAHHL